MCIFDKYYSKLCCTTIKITLFANDRAISATANET